MPRANAQPWLHSALGDSVFILAPSFVSVGLAFLFAAWGWAGEMSPGAWLLFVLGIDVAHVYGTLFRTYFDRREREKRWTRYYGIPLALWLTGNALYSYSPLLFWRCLAYLAVFHFIRQQYGFFRLYSRGHQAGRAERWLDGAAIYACTLYPIVYWHTHLPRAFSWFIDGDFLPLASAAAWSTAAGWAALAIGLAFLTKEAIRAATGGTVSLPRLVFLSGTALSWYVGIVWFNDDLSFTVTNVVSHGVPYLAFSWWYAQKKARAFPTERLNGWLVRRAGVLVFLGIVLAFAFGEEALWNRWIWQEYEQFFGFLSALGPIEDATTRAWVVPLLILPQSTHYILDGLVWRTSEVQEALRA